MDTTYSERIAAEVRAQLARKGYGQRELAHILGKSQQTASNRWRGIHPYTIDEIERIAAFLDIAVEAITAPQSLATAC